MIDELSKSMEPPFPLGALLIFDYAKTPKDRNFIIAHVKETNTILFNTLFIENNERFIKENLDDGNAVILHPKGAILVAA